MDSSTKIFVVEDKSIIRAMLVDLLENRGFEVVGEGDEAERSFEELKKSEADLVLLDINLIGEKDGVWLAQKIRSHIKIPFIYLTAYGDSNTLRRVLESKPNGYLMKPFKEADVVSAIHIAMNNFKELGLNKLNNDKSANNFLIIKDKQELSKVNYDEILFLQSAGNYVEVYTESRKYLVREKLTDLDESLPDSLFMRVHRKYIVRLDKIESYSNIQLKIGSHNIPVSKSYSFELKQKMNWV